MANPETFVQRKIDELKEKSNKHYPRCHALGILQWVPCDDELNMTIELHPRVQPEDIKRVLSEKEYGRWINWSDSITRDTLGIYAWDVEDFLNRKPNYD